MEQMDIERQKREILSEIRRDMNGAVVDVMNDMIGSEPFFSYGVSVVKIKEVASRYAPNHLLAMNLFDTKIRELKLAAIYIDNSCQVTKEQMEHWRESFFSLEIAEHASSMLFYKSSDALKLSYQWLDDKQPFILKAACLIVGKHAKLCFDRADQQMYELLIDKIAKILSENFSDLVRSAAVQCLSFIANCHIELSDYVKERVLKSVSQEVKEELIWRLNYS